MGYPVDFIEKLNFSGPNLGTESSYYCAIYSMKLLDCYFNYLGGNPVDYLTNLVVKFHEI